MTDRTASTSDARKRRAGEIVRDLIADLPPAPTSTLKPGDRVAVHCDGTTRTFTVPQPTQEPDMTAKTRHDELVALLSKISEESVTTSNVLADMLDLLRERLPEPEGIEDEPAPAGDGLAEWERELFRPATCCGKCPPIVGGGYDCTCEGNPKCRCGSVRFGYPDCVCTKATGHEGPHGYEGVFWSEPAPADDLPGEPVEPGDLRAGDRVAFTWKGQRITRTLVNSLSGSFLLSDAPDTSGYQPPVVYEGREWGDGVSDVRLIERAPREDESPDEVLAMDLYHASLKIPPVSEIGPTAWDDATRQKWLDVARAAREHIEAEADDADFSAADLYYARAEKAERALDNATQRVLALTAERDKWNTLAHEADRNAKRHHDRAEKAEAERDEWREIAARYADGRDKWQAKWRESDEARERAEAALADERDRHDATITERDALRDDLADATRQRDEYATQAERWQACHAALRGAVVTDTPILRMAAADIEAQGTGFGGLPQSLPVTLRGLADALDLDDERAKGGQR